MILDIKQICQQFFQAMDGERKTKRVGSKAFKEIQSKTKPIKKEQKQKKNRVQKLNRKQSISQDYQLKETKYKRGKKLKNTRNRSGVTLGRPHQNERIKVQDDPTQEVQSCILKYLQKIGLKHGLAFRPKQRLKMNASESEFNSWGEKDNWNRDKQANKIVRNQKLMSSLAKCAIINQKMTIELMQQALLSASLLVTQECTMDIYETFSQAIESIVMNQNMKAESQRAVNLYRGLIFLTGKFTKQKVKHWLQIIEQDKVQKQFIKMFQSFKAEVYKIIMNVDKCSRFYHEQEWMNAGLKKRRKK